MNEAVRAFLEEPRFAVVATIQPDGMPHQTVLWYELQGNEILLNTAAGRVKDQNLRRDPRLSFCLEDGYRYVTISGSATLVDDQQAAQEDIRRLAVRYHGEARGNEMSRDLFQKQPRVTIRLRIEHLIADGF
ncbi:MAG: PPOX class F420-dependent oxidoreductase [Chloroflexota bacterium]|nr:PPOX class F420-dependent oxidoreductase [Chloroflexota bacterium]